MNKPLILVVEDDPSVRNLITTTLKTNDYRYVVAPNGSAAIMEATSHNPEIILLDLGLPDMDGVQVIQTVRSWSNVPIIVISARSEDNDKIKALDAGADDYLTKPFSVEELLGTLLRVRERKEELLTRYSEIIMEQHLPEPFIRCHKSCIVNINHVTSLSGSTIYLANKQTQTVGRNYLDDVRKALLRIAQ